MFTRSCPYTEEQLRKTYLSISEGLLIQLDHQQASIIEQMPKFVTTEQLIQEMAKLHEMHPDHFLQQENIEDLKIQYYDHIYNMFHNLIQTKGFTDEESWSIVYITLARSIQK